MILLPYPPVARRWKPPSPRPTTTWQRMATFQRQTIQPVATCRQTVEASLATPTTAWQRLATIRDRKGSDNLWRNMP